MEIRQKFMAGAMAVTLGLGFSSGSMGAESDSNRYEPTGGEMFADAVIVRPLTLVSSVVGFAAWVVTIPFTLPSGGTADTLQSWVGDPLAYTFSRPLGDISEQR